MKKYFLLILLLILCFIVFSGSGNRNKIFAWKIKTNGNTIYLTGSLHLLRQENYPLDPAIDRIYEASEQLIFEVHFDSLLSPEAQQRVLRAAHIADGQTFKDIVSDSVYEAINRSAESVGLEMTNLQNYRPWFIAVNISLAKMQKLGFDSMLGLDRFLFNRAKHDNKIIRGIESYREQIELFETLSLKQEELFTQQSMDQFQMIEQEIKEILKCWNSGDAVGLEATFLSSFKKYPDILDRFVYKRNKAWIPIIKKIIDSGVNSMIIVGSGHMPGENGLINLLRSEDYLVEQVSSGLH